jgi:carboxypeptidase family protein/TonB-dependent receptor-like protein
MIKRMRSHVRLAALMAFLLLVSSLPTFAQSTGTIQGTVTDESGAIVANAKISARNTATGIERMTETDSSGNYQIPSLPVGDYRLEIHAQGFQSAIVNDLVLEVGKVTAQNFQLKVGGVAQEVSITADSGLIETTTSTVGQVINQKTVQEIPLNGRHFVDLGLLIPGSVTPPQNGFLTAPLRGQGSFAFNTAGNREDTVNFMINGINLNDMVQNQITFQPSINTVQEFKVDNSTFSAEYGRSSGAIANIATRSGSNSPHGEAFEFLRNDALDARNFFDGAEPPPFKRNQFGGAIGGPVIKDRMFFFFSYEGLRQRQGLTLNSNVLSDAQRARATDPVTRRLLDTIPAPNGIVNSAPGFIGSATAPVNIDQFTGDVNYAMGANDRLHGYYAFQRDERGEPNLQGNTLPGFGDTRQSHRQIMTLNETHTFGPRLVNEARFGFNRIFITFTPNLLVNPADFGINNGINEPIGLPQITITGSAFNIGGPAGFPQGRGDTTFVASDTASYLMGSHAFKFGGEFRRFLNNNFNSNIGSFNFPTIDAFLAGNANTFAVTIGSVTSSIANGALGFFVQDNYKWKTNFTLELGLRYDRFFSPSERFDRFVNFDPATGALVRVGSDLDEVYGDGNNFQPRIGFAWDPFKDGKTSVRGGYAVLADQPVTNVITGLSSNPPLATPLTFSNGTIRFDNAVNVARAAGISPAAVNPEFENSYVQSWNLNVQREITGSLGVMVGYFGSKGTHLRISRNINQRINGLRPFPTIASSSPILPGAPLDTNINQIDSGANSSYNALWVTANKRLSRGLQFNASYTWSKSLDYNSLNSQGTVVQDSFNIRGDRGLSDYDARHRFVINAIYELPFRGNRFAEGWQLSTITQLQSGNPINILSGNLLAINTTTPGFGAVNANTLTGLATLRPDVIGPIKVIGSPTQWFTNTVCDPRAASVCPADAVFALPASIVNGRAVFHFGNLGRNVIIGPGFTNTDFSVLKTTKITERVRAQFRAEIFDIFNHANFGQPNRVAQIRQPNQPFSFGVINSTRFPTGDSGSSRQIQFALKLIF